jgi:catechol 2,3-dioxygenase-like lactoylglutathione lyase family enzyme
MPLLTTPQPSRHPAPTVKARRLTHLIFERPELERAESFLTDFGLRTVDKTASTLHMRAADSSPYCYQIVRGKKASFIGFGLEVKSREDLLRVAALQPGTSIQNSQAPGGGQLVRLTDPSGFAVEIIHGQSHVEPLKHRALLDWNSGERQLRINGTQRPPAEPPDILKLGHLVLEVANFQATCGWYTRHFGFIPSDV